MRRAQFDDLPIIARFLFVALVLPGCGDGSSPSGPGSSQLSVVIAPGAATIGINGAIHFVAVGHEASGIVVPLTALQWSTLDASIVSLDFDMVTGLVPGTARIIARNGSAADTANVVVANIVDITGRAAIEGVANDALGINQAGVIVGQTFPVRAGPVAGRPFVMKSDWQRMELALPEGAASGRAGDISDAGVIVGTSGSDFLDGHALVWSPGAGSAWTVAQLPWTGGPTSFARGVSPNGDFVAGDVFVLLSPNNYGSYPVVWVRTGANGWTLERLPVPDGLGGFAVDVNDSGDVVGGIGYGPIGQAAIWRKQAGVWVLEKLGVQGDDGSTSAQGINAGGVVAGVSQGSAVTWVRTGATWQQWQIFSPQDGVNRSYASGINDAGEVVGAFEKDGSQQAFRWKEGQPVQLLQALSARAAARKINSRGQVIGVSYESNASIFLGTLWPGR